MDPHAGNDKNFDVGNAFFPLFSSLSRISIIIQRVRTSADGPAVGIRASDLFVPLLADVPAADIIDQEVYHLDVSFCSDLLATATCVGCDNMASCCWCRGDFNEIEKKGDCLTHDKQINECGCF